MYVRNFKKSLDRNVAWEHLSSDVTHVFDFFHCPIFVKHAVSDVDLLQFIGWTRFSYITMEKQRGMEFGFRKTATAVIKPDG